MTSITNLPKDFRELLQLLNVHCVEYVIVGGYAVGRHGYPRLTMDLDLLVFPERGNAEKLIAALKDFGFSFDNLTADDFVEPNKVVQLGFPPLRVDLLTSVEGVSVEEAFQGKITDDWGDFPVHFIGYKELIRNKKAAGRPRDIADVAFLEGEKP